MITQKAAMTQAVFQPQKCKSGDLIKPFIPSMGREDLERSLQKLFFTGMLLSTTHHTQ